MENLGFEEVDESLGAAHVWGYGLDSRVLGSRRGSCLGLRFRLTHSHKAGMASGDNGLDLRVLGLRGLGFWGFGLRV